MDTFKAPGALASVALGLCLAQCGTSQSPSSAPAGERGASGGQPVAEADYVERISAARCDVSESCNRVGPGATYRDRDDCMSQTRARVAGQLGASRCRGAIGEAGVSRCLKSLELSECDQPGQLHAVHPRHNAIGTQCNPDLMCLE